VLLCCFFEEGDRVCLLLGIASFLKCIRKVGGNFIIIIVAFLYTVAAFMMRMFIRAFLRYVKEKRRFIEAFSLVCRERL